MNERIRELAKRAGAEFYEGFFGSPNSVKFMEEDFKKFAEFIVKECAEVAGCNGHVSGFALGDLIKQHFGLDK